MSWNLKLPAYLSMTPSKINLQETEKLHLGNRATFNLEY